MDENKDQDRQLFSQIAIDVRENPNRYSRAGKWLDGYCKDKERRQVSQVRRLGEAQQYLVKKYEEQSFIPEDDARCIILITWLLTDPDAEKADLNITQFDKWSWQPADDIFSDSRCAASSLWSQNAHAHDSWIRLVQIAWKTVETQKQTPTRIQRIRAWVKEFVKELYRITIKSFFDSVMGK